jgi:hypothetical protein
MKRDAIEVVEAVAIERSPAMSQRALLTSAVLQTESEQRKLLAEYVQKHMIEGTDYGKIPGTGEKKALLKPGAEKLVDLFRCTPKFTLVKETEDFDRGHGFFAYVFRCRIVQRDSGAVLAEGFGSANSREGRYRWRDAKRKCPNCGKEAIIKGKEEYGGGWVCFKKQGGCNAKFSDGAPAIEGQKTGKVENEDIASQANTILKMAKKRALVDGAIALARCSDMFTQDIEDGLIDEFGPIPPEPEPMPEPAAKPQAVRSVPASQSPEPLRVLEEKIKEATTLAALDPYIREVHALPKNLPKRAELGMLINLRRRELKESA